MCVVCGGVKRTEVDKEGTVSGADVGCWTVERDDVECGGGRKWMVRKVSWRKK